MKKLSEYRDEEALDLIADLVEPVAALVQDKDFAEAFDGNKAAAVRIAIKNHKAEVLQILARLENVPVADYHCDVFTLPARLFEILTDENLLAVFTSPEAASAPSGFLKSV